MSYGMAAALQAAVFQHLRATPTINALVGNNIFDAMPAGAVPETYVTLGPEDVRDASDASGGGAIHRFTVSVVSELSGFSVAKSVASAVSDALEDPALTLDRGRVVGLWFERATAKRTGTAGQARRIDLRFRARVEDN